MEFDFRSKLFSILKSFTLKKYHKFYEFYNPSIEKFLFFGY